MLWLGCCRESCKDPHVDKSPDTPVVFGNAQLGGTAGMQHLGPLPAGTRVTASPRCWQHHRGGSARKTPSCCPSQPSSPEDAAAPVVGEGSVGQEGYPEPLGGAELLSLSAWDRCNVAWRHTAWLCLQQGLAVLFILLPLPALKDPPDNVWWETKVKKSKQHSFSSCRINNSEVKFQGWWV